MQLPMLVAIAAAHPARALAPRPRRAAPRPRRRPARSRPSSATRATSSARPTASASRRSTPPASTCAPWAAFFEKMQRGTRIADDGSVPGYLRTHPVTTERIADAQNRAASLPYKQHPDSLEFHLVRAKLRAEQGDARDARRALPERGARPALRQRAGGALRAGERAAARQAPEGGRGRDRAAARRGRRQPDDRDARRARASQAQGDTAGAVALLSAGARALPAFAPAALRARRRRCRSRAQPTQALTLLGRAAAPLSARPAAARSSQAKTYAALGKRLLQHQAQAEVYVLQGALPAAIEQLQLARERGRRRLLRALGGRRAPEGAARPARAEQEAKK